MKQFLDYQSEALEGKNKISRRKIILGFGVWAFVWWILVKDRNFSPDCIFPDSSEHHRFTEIFYPEWVCWAIISPKKQRVSDTLHQEEVNTGWNFLLEKCIGNEPINQDDTYEYWQTNMVWSILRIHKKTAELSLLKQWDNGVYQVVQTIKFPKSP